MEGAAVSWAGAVVVAGDHKRRRHDGHHGDRCGSHEQRPSGCTSHGLDGGGETSREVGSGAVVRLWHEWAPPRALGC